ncbi:LOW QUALITY PROTEIN: myosin-2 heavy chain-like [Diaphorina citri]|uniref:LOW QUALITY PROTEIN: myosin-2 heavy chain-like n=2 Tax=Diaphorina citri TaxID=121845 RepID=A0A3Q0JAJ2_DIACI|nr:LOW QUALITY PROTEIN: myosin-2 heavy chain-like [Diaphorina citri]
MDEADWDYFENSSKTIPVLKNLEDFHNARKTQKSILVPIERESNERQEEDGRRGEGSEVVGGADSVSSGASNASHSSYLADFGSCVPLPIPVPIPVPIFVPVPCNNPELTIRVEHYLSPNFWSNFLSSNGNNLNNLFSNNQLSNGNNDIFYNFNNNEHHSASSLTRSNHSMETSRVIATNSEHIASVINDNLPSESEPMLVKTNKSIQDVPKDSAVTLKTYKKFDEDGFSKVVSLHPDDGHFSSLSDSSDSSSSSSKSPVKRKYRFNRSDQSDGKQSDVLSTSGSSNSSECSSDEEDQPDVIPDKQEQSIHKNDISLSAILNFDSNLRSDEKKDEKDSKVEKPGDIEASSTLCDLKAESFPHQSPPCDNSHVSNKESVSDSSHHSENKLDLSDIKHVDSGDVRSSDEFSGTESMELVPHDEDQGHILTSESSRDQSTSAGPFTSLIMITEEHVTTENESERNSPVHVNVVTSDTTTFVPSKDKEKFKLTLNTSHSSEDITESETSGNTAELDVQSEDDNDDEKEQVRVVTGGNTLSAVVCLEEGLADDDSWVEELDREELPITDSSEGEQDFPDREEELRGYHRTAIDYSLFTIVEESCEESEVENEKSLPTQLENYFLKGIGGGDTISLKIDDAISETSSIFSEDVESAVKTAKWKNQEISKQAPPYVISKQKASLINQVKDSKVEKPGDIEASSTTLCDLKAESFPHQSPPCDNSHVSNKESVSDSSHHSENKLDLSDIKHVDSGDVRSSDEFSGTESMELVPHDEDQGHILTSESSRDQSTSAGPFTSLIMITEEHVTTENESERNSPVHVNVVTSDTTTFVPSKDKEKFKLTLNTSHSSEDITESETSGNTAELDVQSEDDNDDEKEQVRVVTGGNTLSAVVCLEEGLADDDSWVEELDREELPITDSSEGEQDFPDREEELRGYHRTAIDYSLFTIVEESCEESEVENEKSLPTQLENYFLKGIGGGDTISLKIDDAISETSSIFSEDVESADNLEQEEITKPYTSELGTSRLEQYFLTEFMGFSRRDSDGSVGSDSEGRPSPEQRRKRLVRARGTGRHYSSSLDNLTESEQQVEMQLESENSSSETDSRDDSSSFDKNDGQFDTVKRTKKKKRSVLRGTGRHYSSSLDNLTESEQQVEMQLESENSSSETDSRDDSSSFDKNDGQFDTVKRTKKKKRSVTSAPSLEMLDVPEEHSLNESNREEANSENENDDQMELIHQSDRNKHQSRDSGFMGSSDDLIKETKTVEPDVSLTEEIEEEVTTPEMKPSPSSEQDEVISSVNTIQTPLISTPPNTALSRKDSFNNWSSDEETNLMMSKMKAFFKTMVANQPKPSSPTLMKPRPHKPPQLIYFEDELTRLMKTVPGIREDQVREIVEYLSSEDTWSDSYDSSDYTSSDLDVGCKKHGGLSPEQTRDSALVYQRLLASFHKVDTASSDSSASQNSPPLIAKVMQHIGSRLVALMHEVSSGEGAPSPRMSRYHRRVQPKLSNISTTTEEEEDPMEEFSPLPRSKSHDPLLEEARQEASDNERFSWRGSFESALMVSDSRGRLASGGEMSNSASALAIANAKRRSAGDLLFKSQSREQLDRVRSCGSIGGSVEDKIWGLRQHPKRRRSSVPDDSAANSGGSADGEEDSEDDVEIGKSTTLPRSLQTSCSAGTNSLPRLPTSGASPSIYKLFDGEDYKLVFLSGSDSSSREEIQSDDASSTCSGAIGFMDEADWDYFENSSKTIPD